MPDSLPGMRWDVDVDPAPPAPSDRQLVVIMTPEAAASLDADATGANVPELSAVLAENQLQLEPLFSGLAARADLSAAAADQDAPDLSVFYQVQVGQDRLDEVAAQLRQLPQVDAAYVKPGAEPASLDVSRDVFELPASSDFGGRQGYLNAPPEGVGTAWSRAQAGGDGSGVRIIDVEGAWNFAHEDLAQNVDGVLVGAATNDLGWRNHGTAVIGEIGADDNGFGVVGIAPAAVVGGASIFPGTGSANAIRQAADLLGAGDIMLIELHQPGPRFQFQSRPDQAGYIAMEWWPDDLAALQYARARGIVVVEAAGNGAENLDDPLYDSPAPGFPATWRNPFNTANANSGAVMVGAGAPPPGTHGRDHGPDRSRLNFSNHGLRLDAQGWGREVTTTGGRSSQPGDLQGGAENVWYTDTFSGTSSASPIVVGALAAVQGILRARGLPSMTPARAVEVLRATGSAQQDAPGRPASQRIGNRPDIEAAVAYLSPAVPLVVPNFGYTAGGWRVDKHPRFLADTTGDGRADIIGFGEAGVYLSVS